MSFIIDHSVVRPMDELPEQKMALVKILSDTGIEGWAMTVKIDGELFWYHGGNPFNEEPHGWLAIHEK